MSNKENRSLLAYKVLLASKKSGVAPDAILKSFIRLAKSGEASLVKKTKQTSMDGAKEITAEVEVTAETDVRREVLAMREMYVEGMIAEQDAIFALMSRFPASAALVRKMWLYDINDLRALVAVK